MVSTKNSLGQQNNKCVLFVYDNALWSIDSREVGTDETNALGMYITSQRSYLSQINTRQTSFEAYFDSKRKSRDYSAP